ncbi:MAG: hypothetical protein COA47_12635 [Robiginitomaculum sp.]|nr:MAG: hypothetical protein COA47_12635 [Robiginitomaculum sp.]
MKITEKWAFRTYTQRIIQTLHGFFGRILFWFAITFVVYVGITAEQLQKLHFSTQWWWADFYKITSMFLPGVLVSFFIYFLVVYLPEKRKRQIIKENFRKFYQEIKLELLYNIVFASQKGGRNDISAETKTMDQLMTVGGFRTVFEGGREGDEGWYAFRNYIAHNECEFQEIVFSLIMLAKQIDFILHNYLITDSSTFNYFKRLEILLQNIAHAGSGYDQEKQLSGFLYGTFSGWEPIAGYRGYDPIEKIIQSI